MKADTRLRRSNLVSPAGSGSIRPRRTHVASHSANSARPGPSALTVAASASWNGTRPGRTRPNPPPADPTVQASLTSRMVCSIELLPVFGRPSPGFVERQFEPEIPRIVLVLGQRLHHRHRVEPPGLR